MLLSNIKFQQSEWIRTIFGIDPDCQGRTLVVRECAKQAWQSHRTDARFTQDKTVTWDCLIHPPHLLLVKFISNIDVNLIFAEFGSNVVYYPIGLARWVTWRCLKVSLRFVLIAIIHFILPNYSPLVISIRHVSLVISHLSSSASSPAH